MAKHMQSKPVQADTPVEEPVRRRHRILDHKILTTFLIFGLFMASTVFFTLVFALTCQISDDTRSTLSVLGSAVLMLVLWRLLMRKEFRGFTGWTTAGFLLGLPVAAFCLPNVYDIVMALKDGEALSPVPHCLFMALAPGIGEEVMFRAVSGSNWMRLGTRERDIIFCTLFTALFFALVHGSNILAGAALSSTIFQLFYAFCTGVGFCALVLRTGSLWPSMFAHVLIDFTGFLPQDLETMGIMTDELVFDTSFYIALAGAVFVLIYGLYLIRPSKQPEVQQVWDQKWRRA